MVDEVQRVPALIPALKLVVDRDRRPGRFLLTGSANLLRMPAMQDSLAGRAENVDLYGFSQGELAGVLDRFVDRVLAGESFLGFTSDLTRVNYLERACAGGYPEAAARPAGRRRSAWFDNYVRRIVERDAADISALERLADLPQLLRLLAARKRPGDRYRGQGGVLGQWPGRPVARPDARPARGTVRRRDRPSHRPDGGPLRRTHPRPPDVHAVGGIGEAQRSKAVAGSGLRPDQIARCRPTGPRTAPKACANRGASAGSSRAVVTRTKGAKPSRNASPERTAQPWVIRYDVTGDSCGTGINTFSPDLPCALTPWSASAARKAVRRSV